MKQSVQMWDNKHLTILEGIPITIPSAPEGYTLLFCQTKPRALWFAWNVACVYL